MRQPCGARLAGVGGLLLWLLTATLLMKASPAAAGCPFRHGLRFADDPGVPKPPTVDTPAVTQYSSHEGTKSSGQDLEAHVAHATSPQGSTSRTNVARRLKGLIGLGVDLGLDQSLTKDTITTAPRATREKVNRTATPYLLFPYGRPNRPSSPLDKDWASVVSACKTVGEVEKRLNNFFIRAAFHDGMAVAADCPTCSGLDGSMLLNASELLRPENDYESFATTTSRVVLKIARWYKVSASDVLAVCAAVATETLGGPQVFGPNNPLPVGRLDSTTASMSGQLPGASITAGEFAAWWKARGFTVAEGVALMGSHSLLDEQTCYRGRDGNPRDYCDPSKELCHDIRMFSWKNHYYVDACTPSVKVVPDAELPEVAAYDALTEAEMIRTDTPDELRADLRREVCKWTSPERRAAAQAAVLSIRRGTPVKIPAREPATAFFDAAFKQCSESDAPAIVKKNCHHPQTWFYTLNDAYLAAECQAKSPGVPEVKQAMMKYLNQAAWDVDYVAAFHKMVNMYATFRNDPTTKKTVTITGTECSSGYATNRANMKSGVTCSTTLCPLKVPKSPKCPSVCTCKTAFRMRRARSLAANPDTPVPTSGQVVLPPTVWTPPTDDVIGPGTPGLEQAEPNMVQDVPPTSMGKVPPSPYGGPEICAADGAPVEVGGYPSSPYKATPFSVTYDKSVMEPLKPEYINCRTLADGAPPHCMVTYAITARDFRARLWDATLTGCIGKPDTELLGYNSRVPGPTITAPAGHQVMVRFTNEISENALDGEQHWPCVGTRKGRPISQHLHGSASLAPYDGWADDVTCKGESKDYVYPNQRPTSAWYHDHGIHVTGDNAYHGLAGWYIISGKQKHGACGEPYNLEHMPERLIMLSDKVLDNNCQLYYNHAGPHRNNIYGDINMVNGQPWPNMPLDAVWVRFRLLNAAMVRPYLIKIKDITGADVAQKICHVIAADGGYRAKPVPFPAEGLQMGVAERYDIVCNFAEVAGQTLYLWNGRNEGMMKAVPYFCYSHLLARIQVGLAQATETTPVPDTPTDPAPQPGTEPAPVENPGTELNPVVDPGAEPAPGVDPGVQAASVTPAASLKVPASNADLAAAGRRRLQGARVTAPTVTAKTASVTAMAAGTEQAAKPGVFDATQEPHMPMAMHRVLSEADIAKARELIRQDAPHRTFKFGRRNGHWVINGETWDTATIAADDVGHNTWELWLLRTGGGWFHPIHMHLVDFYVLQRGEDAGDDGLFAYERHAPKDVVYLGPSQRIWVIARFGAHRGSYMFHCHNLVHEDYDMLRAMTIITAQTNTAAGQNAPVRHSASQMPALTWVAGVVYDTYGDPMTNAASAKPNLPALDYDYCKGVLEQDLYRIYYPATTDPQYDLLHGATNPWEAPVCDMPQKQVVP